MLHLYTKHHNALIAIEQEIYTYFAPMQIIRKLMYLSISEEYDKSILLIRDQF